MLSLSCFVAPCRYEALVARREEAKAAERAQNAHDQDACCAVCGGSDSLPKDAILFCDRRVPQSYLGCLTPLYCTTRLCFMYFAFRRCDLAVHQMCYGVTVIPEGDWFCAPCSAGLYPTELPCILCDVQVRCGTREEGPLCCGMH